MTKTTKLNLPKILSIKLNGFSLYKLEPNIELTMGSGVFCLAGANGLGKSTFLTALNYAVTGIVRAPNKSFKSAEDFYNDEMSINYSNNYFDGRIKEEDREISSIDVRLQVGNVVYKITREVFEPNQLQELSITSMDGNIVILESDTLTPHERNSLYQQHITKDIGLGTFQQFIFLQLFVFTFDESRYLLLWDKRALNTAIHLCVGADFKKVQESEKLLRDMEKAGSRARNHSWHASSVRNEIHTIQGALGLAISTKELEDLEDRHQSIQNDLKLIEDQIDQKRDQLSDTQLKWSEANSELATFQIAYTREFNSRLQRRTRVELHPTIASSLEEGKCSICGSQSDKSIKSIQHKIENGTCPLCESLLPKASDDSLSLEKLKQIDKSIIAIKKSIDSLQKTTDRVRSEFRVLEKKRENIYEELDQFEKANEKALYQIRATSSGAESSLQSKLETLNDLLQKKKIAFAERDKKKAEYLVIQKELEKLYAAAQNEFVPLFRDLAFLFLGIDVDMRLEFSTSTDAPGVSLTLEMQGIVRRQDQQLSESQRFFVDIALRMAIAQFMANHNAGASLFIDTPEGSLDIAYESRVGQMFAEFVKKENSIIMTANINSSQILLKLASLCGEEKMSLQKMTTWSELSDVQIKEDHLFTNALNDIEKALAAHI